MVGVFLFWILSFIFITVNTDDVEFEQFDDNNLYHVMNGPDYGQFDESKQTHWSVESSPEYKRQQKLTNFIVFSIGPYFI